MWYLVVFLYIIPVLIFCYKSNQAIHSVPIKMRNNIHRSIEIENSLFLVQRKTFTIAVQIQLFHPIWNLREDRFDQLLFNLSSVHRTPSCLSLVIRFGRAKMRAKSPYIG